MSNTMQICLKNLFMKVKTFFEKSKVYYEDLSTTFFKIKIDIFLH